MQATLSDGRTIEFPDGTDQATIDAYIAKYHTVAEPNIAERTIGHLSKGVANVLKMGENVGSLLDKASGGTGVVAPAWGREALENNQYTRQIEAHPETSLPGQLLAGAVEFLPSMPVYSILGGGVLRGATLIPKVGKYVAPLVTKGAGPISNYARAIGRAGAEGTIVGGTIGIDATQGVGAHIEKGIEEGIGFAGATAVLHPAMAGLGAVGKSIFRRFRGNITPEKMEVELGKRAETDPRAAEELQAFKQRRAEDVVEKEPAKFEEEELYVPKGEEILEGDAPIEETPIVETKTERRLRTRLKKLGYTGEDIAAMSKAERIDTLKKKITKPIEKEGELSGSGVERGEGTEGKEIEQQEAGMQEESVQVGESEIPSVQNLNKGEDVKIEEPKLKESEPEPKPEQIDKAEEIVNKIEEKKLETTEVEEDIDTELEDEFVSGLLEKLDKPSSEPDAIADTVSSAKALKDPTLDTLIENMPKNRDEIDLATRREMIAKAVEKAKLKKAEVPNKKGKARRQRVDEQTLQEEWNRKLEEEGLGELSDTEELPDEGFRFEDDQRSLHFDRDEIHTYDDIEDGVYLDNLGLQSIYNMARKIIHSKQIQKAATSNKVVAEINGKKLTKADDLVFADSARQRFADNIERMYKYKLASPDFAFKDNKKMEPLITDAHLKFFEGNFEAAKRNEVIRVAQSHVPEIADQEMIRDILEGKIKDAPEHVQKAADLIKGELSAVRERYKDYLRNEMKRNLNEDENAALAEILSGKNIDKVIEKYKEHIVISKTGKRMRRKWVDADVIRNTIKEYNEIDKWGLDDYFTHYERGSYRLMSEGKLFAKAVSVEDAARKFADLHEMYPDKNFTLDTAHNMEGLSQGLSRRAYNRVLSNLQKGLEKSIDDINASLARRIAKKGLDNRFFIKPSKQFSPYTMERSEYLQGEKNVFDVLYNYMYSMEKKMALDPAIDNIRKAISKTEIIGQEPYTAKDGKIKMRDIKRPYLNEEETKFLERYVEDLKGRMYKGDEVVDSLFKGFANPRLYSRAIQTAREVQANLKLGYAPIKGLINGASGTGHVWVKTGTKYINEGIGFLRTEEGKAFIKGMEPYLGVNVVESATGELTSKGTFEKLGILSKPETTLGKIGHAMIEPLGAFQAPEVPVRKLTLAANYLMAKDSGLGEEAARIAAIKANWFQQFTYDMASLPEFMRSPTGRLLTQFKPYLMKELEFISTLRGPEIARYIGMQLALGGPRGLVMVAKSVPILAMYGGWSELEDWMNKEHPVASRGIGGALGVDITAAATFQFPSQMKDWVGPTISDLISLNKNVYEPIKNGEGFGAKEASAAIKGVFPMFRHISNIWEQVVDKDGWVKDERNRRIYHIDNMGAFVGKSLAGAEPIELNRIRVAEYNQTQKSMKLGAQKTRTIDDILDAISKGKAIDQDSIDAMVRLGIKPSTLRQAAKFRVLDARMRRLLMTEVIRRPEILREYPEAGDLE